MVRSFFSAFGREVRGMHEAAYILAGFAFGSQLLALVRDRLFASTFGVSDTLDLYYAAFRIPDFLFATIASLLSLYALLPVLTRLARENNGLMVSFLRQILFIFFMAMSVIAIVFYILTPWLVLIVAPGIGSPELVTLVRILLLQPILLGASNILAAFTQMRHRFFLYAISPLLYNLGIIFGILVLYPRLGIVGLAWGVVFGACMHVLIQVPFFAYEKVEHTLPRATMYKELWSVLGLSLPRTLALTMGQISLLALVAMASVLSAGSISVFTFAFNLQTVPLAIIGVSYSVAAFPTLARFHASGAQAEFVRYVETALRHIFFWAIPATVFIVVLRAQLVRVILGAGTFGWGATRLTAAALALFALSLAAQSATLLITRAYYAAGKTKKPLYFGIVEVVVSISSAFVLMAIFRTSDSVRHGIESALRVSDVSGTLVLMLALGFTFGSIVKFIVAFTVFVRDFNIPRKRIVRLIAQSFFASVIGGLVTYVTLTLTGSVGEVHTTLGLMVQSFGAGIAGLLVTALILYALKNQESVEISTALHRRFKKKSIIIVETTEVS